MSYVNFIISRINYLPYYVPLVIEAKTRHIKSKFFLSQSDKPFISPYTSQHLLEITNLAKQHQIEVYDITKLIEHPAITFFCEGDIVGKTNKTQPSPNFQFMTSKHTKVSIVCNYEYVMFYNDYINNVDHVIMLHKFWASHFRLLSPKNLYLGSPKYDPKYFRMGQTGEERIQYLNNKYNLDMYEKYIIIIFPKDPKKHHKRNTSYPTKEFLLEIYKAIRAMGYKIIVKTRKQDPVKDKQLRGDYYFEDIDFYPCNSMELIEISRMVLYFSSSINEECVALLTPYIDIKVDKQKDRFHLLNERSYGYSYDIQRLIEFGVFEQIKKLIRYYEQMHYRPDKINSNKVFQNYYTSQNWEGAEGASERIIDWVEQKYTIVNDVKDTTKNTLQ
jgi:hypothetical protein